MATTPNADLPLTEQFLRYGRYVRNWSPRTVECYRQALRECPATITKASLNATVVAMRERVPDTRRNQPQSTSHQLLPHVAPRGRPRFRTAQGFSPPALLPPQLRG